MGRVHCWWRMERRRWLWEGIEKDILRVWTWDCGFGKIGEWVFERFWYGCGSWSRLCLRLYGCGFVWSCLGLVYLVFCAGHFEDVVF